MIAFVKGQLLTADALNAAFAQYVPTGTVSAYVASLLTQTSYAALMTALGFPAGLPGAANGMAVLDATGKVLASQLPASVVGSLNYQGAWNASTNSPALASGTGTKGYYYKVSVAGTTSIDGNANWNAGDIIAFNGTTWDKIDGPAEAVTTVAGRTGAVTLAVGDVSGAAPLASPAFTGSPTAPTPAAADNSTKVATTAMVQAAIAANASAVTSVAGRTGAVTLAVGDVSGAAPLASPAFTGSPTAPTQAGTDNSTKIATTAQVQAAIAASAPTVYPTVQNVVTGSRASGTVYQNTTGRPMHVTVSGNGGSNAATVKAYTDSSPTPTTEVARLAFPASGGVGSSMHFVVLPGNYYEVSGWGSGFGSMTVWTEWY